MSEFENIALADFTARFDAMVEDLVRFSRANAYLNLYLTKYIFGVETKAPLLALRSSDSDFSAAFVEMFSDVPPVVDIPLDFSFKLPSKK